MHVLRTGNADNILRESLALFRLDTYQHNTFFPVQQPGKFKEVMQSFLPAPDARHSLQNAFALQAIACLGPFRFTRCKDLGINAVVNDTVLVIFQE